MSELTELQHGRNLSKLQNVLNAVVCLIRCRDRVFCICEYIMSELTELEHGRNLGALMAGASMQPKRLVFQKAHYPNFYQVQKTRKIRIC